MSSENDHVVLWTTQRVCDNIAVSSRGRYSCQDDIVQSKPVGRPVFCVIYDHYNLMLCALWSASL